ncbi:MAG TPA: CHAP domain-containing protein [Mycobacteriales bacterium]|nr:CHAP domain-containing protein [Mycobacteriales bacterium]
MALIASLLILKPWHLAQSATSNRTPSCGKVLLSGSSWLGGAGVDVRSNGDEQTSTKGCANGNQEIYNLGANPPIFGFGWQCVELVNRLYATRGWFPKLWLGPDTNQGAKWLYTYAARGDYPGLTAHANGSGYKPVPGDMIVHSNGDTGHVAIVNHVDGRTLYAAEQNNNPTGQATYGYDPATGRVTRAGATISGYVHAKKNTGRPTTDRRTTAGGTTHSTAPTGISYVLSDSPPDRTALRSCPGLPTAGVSSGECPIIERLADRSTVIMRCWTDTSAPPDHTSPRWFFVNEVNGPHPGWSGYVYSDLVHNQIRTPGCTDAIINVYQKPAFRPPPPLSFEVIGSCTSNGGELHARSANFTPGGPFEVSASYQNGAPYPLAATSGTVRPDGSVGWIWPCAGDPPQTYQTSLVDLRTGRTVTAYFTIPPGPGSPPGKTTPPVPTNSPRPPTRTITVFDKVTNGGTAMREDTPAYLSTVTHNFCRSNGCALAGTDVSTGAHLTATCQVHGDRTTNGQDNSTIDDHNPGLYTSTRWYGIRWADGRFGYISEVWITSSDRGGLGLPGC